MDNYELLENLKEKLKEKFDELDIDININIEFIDKELITNKNISLDELIAKANSLDLLEKYEKDIPKERILDISLKYGYNVIKNYPIYLNSLETTEFDFNEFKILFSKHKLPFMFLEKLTSFGKDGMSLIEEYISTNKEPMKRTMTLDSEKLALMYKIFNNKMLSTNTKQNIKEIVSKLIFKTDDTIPSGMFFMIENFETIQQFNNSIKVMHTNLTRNDKNIEQAKRGYLYKNIEMIVNSFKYIEELKKYIKQEDISDFILDYYNDDANFFLYFKDSKNDKTKELKRGLVYNPMQSIIDNKDFYNVSSISKKINQLHYSKIKTTLSYDEENDYPEYHDNYMKIQMNTPEEVEISLLELYTSQFGRGRSNLSNMYTNHIIKKEDLYDIQEILNKTDDISQDIIDAQTILGYFYNNENIENIQFDKISRELIINIIYNMNNDTLSQLLNEKTDHLEEKGLNDKEKMENTKVYNHFIKDLINNKNINGNIIKMLRTKIERVEGIENQNLLNEVLKYVYEKEEQIRESIKKGTFKKR